MENTTIIEKWYETKVAFLIATMTPLVIVMSFLFGMQRDIAVINNSISNINLNHEVHIQDITQEIKDLKKQQGVDEAQMVDLQKQIISLIKAR